MENLQLLTPEEAYEKNIRALEFINDYYKNEFSEDAYMPVIRDGLEEKLNLMQFAINFANNNPFISQADRAIMVQWVTQLVFWLGYTEKNKAQIELPKSIMDYLDAPGDV